MEKSRIIGKEQFCNRLLKFFLFITLLFIQNAYSITPQEIKNLVIRPEENVFFTNQELKYVLEIPGVDLSDVQTQLQPMKEGVTCISSRRLDYFTNDESTGARIEFWFTFKNTGVGEIPPLITRIKGYVYYLPFEKIQVYENPKTIAPRIVVELNKEKVLYSQTENSKKTEYSLTSEVAEPIEILISIQYTTQIKQFGYEIPKDSLFQEVEKYEILTQKIKLNDFSHDRIPVAKFIWTPLKEGKFVLPNIRVYAVAYSGRTVELFIPECQVTITKNSTADVELDSEKSPVFAYALTDPLEEDFLKKSVEISSETYNKIAKLRSKEKHSFGPLPSIRKERILLEQSAGITDSIDESSIPLWTVVFILFILLSAVSILLFMCRKKVSSIIVLCFAIVFAFLSLILGLFITEKHGVVKGGSISPVPEDSALSSTSVTAGICVKIREQTEKWYYIEYNENGGWIKKENILLVE
ncbi:MAG: hypothetical protein J6Y36_00910 [Treponema sp.]|nr:hypothetical protein [Treponema sp.]